MAINRRMGKWQDYKEKYQEELLSAKRGSHIRDLDLDV